jgi:hypothetical protein
VALEPSVVPAAPPQVDTDTHQPPDLFRCLLQQRWRLGDGLGQRAGHPQDAAVGVDASVEALPRLLPNRASQNDDWHAQGFGPPGDLGGDFAQAGLGIESAFGGDDYIRSGQLLVEVEVAEDHVVAGPQGRSE